MTASPGAIQPSAQNLLEPHRRPVVLHQFLNDGAHLFPIMATGTLDALLVPFEPAGFFKDPRHAQRSSSVVLVVLPDLAVSAGMRVMRTCGGRRSSISSRCWRDRQ